MTPPRTHLVELSTNELATVAGGGEGDGGGEGTGGDGEFLPEVQIFQWTQNPDGSPRLQVFDYTALRGAPGDAFSGEYNCRSTPGYTSEPDEIESA